jgi:subtilisin family serine protease
MAPQVLGMIPILCLVGFLFGSHADASEKKIELDVRFVGGQVADNFAVVVSRLGQAGLIPNEVQLSLGGMSPSEQLFSGKPIPGNAVTNELLRYLCDLNSHAHVCIQRSDGKIEWHNQATTRSVVLHQQCPSSLLLLDELCLPTLKIQSYPASVKIDFNGKMEDLKSKLVTLGSCKTLDAQCINLNINFMTRLNPGLEMASTKKGEIIGLLRFPINAYRLSLIAADDSVEKSIRSTVDQIVTEREKAGLFDQRNPNIYITAASAEFTHQAETTSQATPLPPQDNLLKAMGWITPEQRNNLAAFPPVTVGVWDTAVDTEHCDFLLPPPGSQNRVVVKYEPVPMLGPPQQIARTNCGTIRDATIDDHGTHVAGLIVSSGSSGVGLGVNPKARLWVYQMDPKKLVDDGDPIERAFRDGLAPRIINISMTSLELSYLSQLQVLLMGVSQAGSTQQRGGWQDDALFIAAAGNSGAHHDSLAGCDVYPACWSSDPLGHAIISVVALNRGGDELMTCTTKTPDGGTVTVQTNYGLAFDVAAIGFGVSSLVGDFIGDTCGTSEAAPYVTGLASLIYSEAVRKSPQLSTIRERIFMTADMLDSLESKVRYGKINFSRALNYQNDVVVVAVNPCNAPGPCTSEISGSVAKRTRSIHVEEAWENGNRLQPTDISLDQIKRIVLEKSHQNRFRVLFQEGSMLRHLRDVAFAPGTGLDFSDNSRAGQQSQQITMATIVDLTFCSISCNIAR